MRRLAPLPAAAALLLAACGGDPAREALRVERDTVGDTVIVRTVAGSGWERDRVLVPDVRIGALEGEDHEMLGEVTGIAEGPGGVVYAFDRQVPAIRKYGADGEYLGTFGREGGGPGEYKSSDGGLAVLPDGRVLLRDPGGSRINVYSPDGEPLDQWPLRGGFFTSRPLFVDTAGSVYTQIWGRRDDDERYAGLLRYQDGQPRDSILEPEWDHEPASITFSGERIRMMNTVPFSPATTWTFSPHGYYIGGLSTRYAVEVFRPDGTILRIERVADPVPVDPAEKDAERESITRNFRQYQPDWSWNGPDIPDEKPPFRDIAVGGDGRIWVLLSRPGAPGGARAPDIQTWTEPVVWDVFEPDGTYLGQVHAPDGFRTDPHPIFGSDHVWGVQRDELDVQYLTRYTIRPAGRENPSN